MQPVFSEKQQQQLLTRILVPCHLKRKYSLYHAFKFSFVNSKPEIAHILGNDAVQPVRSVLPMMTV
jgi:hypothetical protein